MHQKNTNSIIRRELKKRALILIAVVVLILLGTAIGLIQPLLLKRLVDIAIPTRNLSLVGWLLVGIVAIPLVGIGFSLLQDFYRGQIGEAVSQGLRQEAFNHTIQARIDKVETIKTGEIMHRITRECGRIGEVYISQQLLPLSSNVLIFIGTLAVMWTLNPRMTLIISAAFPLSLLMIRYLGKGSRVLDKQFSDLIENGQNYLQEVIQGLRTVRGFGAEEFEKKRWLDWIKNHWNIKIKELIYHNFILNLPTNLIQNILIGFLFGYGAFECINGRLSVGGLLAFVAYTPRAYTAFQSMLTAHIGIQQMKVAADKIDDLLSLPLEESGQRILPPSDNKGASVEFREVCFSYLRESFSVQKLSFIVEPGQFVGIVGPSGGGKSTIVDLLMSFYEPDSGDIFIDGINIKDLSLTGLRQQIGLISQDIFLWDASIRENIVYPGSDFDNNAVVRAVEIAQIDSFIHSLPEGYDTRVGERGITLSGGERQRLAMARAVLRGPRILLLDEATAALDARTEMKMRQAIEATREGRTIIAVAHRLASVINADKIIVIENGKVIESGTISELLALQGVFYELYNAQSLELD